TSSAGATCCGSGANAATSLDWRSTSRTKSPDEVWSDRTRGGTVASSDTRVVVVTGGAAGIGAAIAEEVAGSGAFVVTVDPGVNVDGSVRTDASVEPTTAERIVAAGGQARASNTSVTDAAAVSALFNGLVEEFGSLDAVVNVAGITRPTGFALGKEDGWTALLQVHLDGHLNLLRAAPPILSAPRH